MSYAAQIKRLAPSGIDPRHVEGWMRVEHGTLDALTPERFQGEVLLAVELARMAPEDSEKLAQSYGL